MRGTDKPAQEGDHRRDHARTAYRLWASHYDGDRAYVPFHRLGSAFETVIERYSPAGRRLLDLGCGTGVSALGFSSCGYDVTGCDISAAMLDIAATKPGADQVRFVQADIRDLPDLGEFDLAVAMNDPISHLLLDDDLVAAFTGIARSLRPGGVFLFDQHTLPAYRWMVANTNVDERDDHTATWTVTEDSAEPEPIFALRIDRTPHDSDVPRISHRHYLRYRSKSSLCTALARCGMDFLGIHEPDHPDAVPEDDPDERRHQTLIYAAHRVR